MNIATIGNLLGPDTLIIGLVVLLLFGAKKLPELARGMGQAVREFSKAKDDIEREVTRAAEPPRPALYEPKTAADLDHHEEVSAAHHGDATAPAAQPEVHHPTPLVESEVLPPKPAVNAGEHHDPTHVA